MPNSKSLAERQEDSLEVGSLMRARMTNLQAFFFLKKISQPFIPRSRSVHKIARCTQRSLSSVVERLLHTQDVTSSSLVVTTIFQGVE